MSKKKKTSNTRQSDVNVVEVKFSVWESIGMFFQSLGNFFLINRAAMAVLLVFIIVNIVLAIHLLGG